MDSRYKANCEYNKTSTWCVLMNTIKLIHNNSITRCPFEILSMIEYSGTMATQNQFNSLVWSNQPVLIEIQ